MLLLFQRLEHRVYCANYFPYFNPLTETSKPVTAQREENKSDSLQYFGTTRVKYIFHSDKDFPSSTKIKVQLDLVTPSVVVESLNEIETIRESKIFRDVEAFVRRHFACLEIVKETKYYDKIAMNSASFAKINYYFAQVMRSSFTMLCCTRGGGFWTIGLTRAPSSRTLEEWKFSTLLRNLLRLKETKR